MKFAWTLVLVFVGSLILGYLLSAQVIGKPGPIWTTQSQMTLDWRGPNGKRWLTIYPAVEDTQFELPPRAVVFEDAPGTVKLCSHDEQHCKSLAEFRIWVQLSWQDKIGVVK
jgi:hypothetical protein